METVESHHTWLGDKLESKASLLSHVDQSEDPDGKLLDHVQASVSNLLLACDAVSCPIAHAVA